MNYLFYYVAFPTLLSSVSLIIITIIKEKEKGKRIILFKEFETSKN